MNVALKQTNGEEAVLGVLEKAGPQSVSAINLIKSQGLPTRRVETWHYTDLRNLLKDYPDTIAVDEARAKSVFEANRYSIASVELPIINGEYHQQLAGQIPQKVLVSQKSYSGETSEFSSDDTIGWLNSGLAKDGLAIVVNDKATIEERICLTHISQGESSSASRHNVKIGKSANAILLERHLSADDSFSASNTICDLEVGDGADVTWIVDQQMSEKATRFGQLNVNLGADTKLTILVLNSGGKLVRQEINVEVRGENSNLYIRGVNLIGEGSHIDVTTKLDHLVANTNSEEIFRNVVVEDGHGVFQGQINVAQIAQLTDARMACNSLLLSDRSEFSAKPELEIFADNVQCAHGATVTDIDDNHLFYLMTRGIPEKIARDMLVKAFVEEVFEGLEVELIGENLNARIDNWLDENG